MGYDRIPPTYAPLLVDFYSYFFLVTLCYLLTPFLFFVFFSILAHLARISSWCVVARRKEGQGLVTNWQQNGARNGKQAKIGEGKKRETRGDTQDTKNNKKERGQGRRGIADGELRCWKQAVSRAVRGRGCVASSRCVVICLPFS